jgi:hypothetical protein
MRTNGENPCVNGTLGPVSLIWIRVSAGRQRYRAGLSAEKNADPETTRPRCRGLVVTAVSLTYGAVATETGWVPEVKLVPVQSGVLPIQSTWLTVVPLLLMLNTAMSLEPESAT